MADFIPSNIIPPGIADDRARAFVAAFSAVLSEFSTTALIVQDAYTVLADYLPAMIIEAGLTDFVSLDMREDLVREMIASAPEIHAMTGTVAGARRALASIGVTARWTQWFQEVPKAGHDTHKVVLWLSDTVINGRAPLDLANQRAVARVLEAVKRKSQDITIQYGMRGSAQIYMGATSRRGRTVRLNGPQLGDASFSIPTYAGTGARAVRQIRINAKA